VKNLPINSTLSDFLLRIFTILDLSGDSYLEFPITSYILLKVLKEFSSGVS
jgi:hypothetical protein